MFGREESYLVTFFRKIKPVLLSFAVGEIKGTFVMYFGSGVV